MEIIEFAEEIAKEAHTRCGKQNEHEYTGHLHTSTFYARELFGLYTATQIVDAIIALAGDPVTGTWTSHPHPVSVLDFLDNGGVK